jgi:plasma-membrane proton-efflux P-type ATPase
MLELIFFISIFLQKYDDVFVVGVLLLANALLSFFLERRATLVIEALKQRLQIQVRVFRNSQWFAISAKELVPGDIIRIRAGDFVPADLLIMDGELEVDQSAITGESIDVHCGGGNELISGSVVRRGEAKAIVQATGLNTQYGKTATLIEKAQPKLHIEQVVVKVVSWLFIVVVVMMAVVVMLAFMRGTPLLETIPILLILLMSAIPISLPVMFTVCLSIGAKNLSKHGVLVTRLSAVEDAATMSQLCIDKTGTITLNRLHIVSITPYEGASEDEVAFYGAIASQESNQDPIDLAFIEEAKSRGKLPDRETFEVISFTPFDPIARSTQALVSINGLKQYVMKGAVLSVMGACSIDQGEVERINLQVDELGRKGYRVLALAKGSSLHSLEFIGLVALFDPPRPDARQFIELIQGLGVSLKMLTGDALVVAKELASRVGLGPIFSFSQLDVREDGGIKSPEQLNLAMKGGGFAEVFPENKYLVVKQLQSLGFVTGMTGDGVNDAPALRQAEVGIAVSGSTDIARGAASIVLTEPGLINIVHLITHGRMVYQRLLTWIINKISRTIQKAPYVAIAYLITGKFVVSAFAMLLLVLVTDLTKIALATDRVRPSSNPETWKINGYIGLAIVIGLAMLIESLLLLWFGWNYWGLSSNDAALNTFSFLCLLYMGAFSILSVRERLYFWSSKPGTILLISFVFEVVVGTMLASNGLRGMESLPWGQTISIFMYSMVCCLLINDFIKHKLIQRLK